MILEIALAVTAGTAAYFAVKHFKTSTTVASIKAELVKVEATVSADAKAAYSAVVTKIKSL